MRRMMQGLRWKPQGLSFIGPNFDCARAMCSRLDTPTVAALFQYFIPGKNVFIFYFSPVFFWFGSRNEPALKFFSCFYGMAAYCSYSQRTVLEITASFTVAGLGH